MIRIMVTGLAGQIGQKVTVKGFVHQVRNQKNMQFLILRDSTGLVQCAHYKPDDDEITGQINDITRESAIALTGRVVKNNKVKLGQLEIQIESITVYSLAAATMPIDEDTAPEIKMDWRYLSLRTERNQLVFNVQTILLKAMRDFWVTNGFVEFQTPKTTATASEGGAEVFGLDYFGNQAYLTQSPQLYKQMAIASGFSGFFEIGPAFRAEMSMTTRHAAEFTSVDFEMAWIDSHEDIMQIEEKWLQYVLKTVQKEYEQNIIKFFGVEVVVPEFPFPRLTLQEARQISSKMGHKIEHKDDLDPEGERLVSQYIEETHGHQFVFITDYPASGRAFYHKRYEDRQDIAKGFDLLWKGVEVTTGAQREHRLAVLEKQAVEKGINLESIAGYLDFFRYGMPPHGGYGFGFARFLMKLLELPNIREATFLHRGPNRLTP